MREPSQNKLRQPSRNKLTQYVLEKHKEGHSATEIQGMILRDKGVHIPWRDIRNIINEQ